ncbi:MAG: hypothetical protein RDU89_05935 [bacterium]|nr:hypothetical protein [bacterium]
MRGGKLSRAAILVGVLMGVLAFRPAGPLLAGSPGNYGQELAEYVSYYHDNLDRLPLTLRLMLAGHRVNGHIDTGEGVVVIGLTTSPDARIARITAGGVHRPTVNIYLPSPAVDGLLADPSPETVLAAMQALRMEGVGLANWVKVRLAGTVLLRVARLVAAAGAASWWELLWQAF